MYLTTAQRTTFVPSVHAYALLALFIGASLPVAGDVSHSDLSVVNTTQEGYNIHQYLDLNETDIDFDEDGAADGESDEEVSVTNRVDEDDDIVSKFLGLVEEYKKNKKNCTKGTSYNLGIGVVRQYGLKRFKNQALIAVNRANFLSRLWKNASPEVLDSEFLLYSAVRDMVEGDSDIFGGGNCYGINQYKDYFLYCPYAYIMPDGRINVKDLSVEYKYNKDNEWFYQCGVNANRRLETAKNYTVVTENTILVYHIRLKSRVYHNTSAMKGDCNDIYD